MRDHVYLETVRGLDVLVTGAAQGMGAIYARKAVAEGARRLVLWDYDQMMLDELVAELAASPTRTTLQAQVVDLREQVEIQRAAAETLKAGAPQILINNAGVVTGTRFQDHTRAQIRDTIAVNTLAPMYLVHALLPAMLQSGEPSRVMTVSSAAAFVSNPGMSVYAASKAAALTWSDSVRLELEQGGHRQVKVTTFCPTYISTGMFAGAKSMLLTPILDPQVAADTAWAAMLRGTPLVMLPWTTKLGQLLRGVLPRRAWDFVAERVFGIYRSMENFTGRKDDAART